MDKQKIKSVPRLTTDNPVDNFQTALNFTDVSEDGWVWLRQPEMALTEYARQLVKGHGSSIDLNCNDMELSESLTDHLFDDPKQSIDGLIAEHYTILWAYATLREKLKWYEDAGIPVIPNYGLSTIRRAINRYGTTPQLQMAIKEMSELTKAICNLQRAVTFNYRNGAKIKVAHESVREEIADVYIMLAQLVEIVGKPEEVQQIVLEKLEQPKATWTAGRCKVSKAVLLSIRPNWCKKIANLRKTVEIRKTAPNLEVPFKCYIYCTKAPKKLITIFRDGEESYDGEIYHGKTKFITWDGIGVPDDIDSAMQMVIGEFVCDDIRRIGPEYCVVKEDIESAISGSCLTVPQVKDYAGWKSGMSYADLKDLYGWHISDLKIYDRPRPLSDFTRLRATKFGYEPVEIRRPPQSWFYVEDAECTS